MQKVAADTKLYAQHCIAEAGQLDAVAQKVIHNNTASANRMSTALLSMCSAANTAGIPSHIQDIEALQKLSRDCMDLGEPVDVGPCPSHELDSVARMDIAATLSVKEAVVGINNVVKDLHRKFGARDVEGKCDNIYKVLSNPV